MFAQYLQTFNLAFIFSQHAQLLVYDWSDGGDVETVVEDIEKLTFEEHFRGDDPKMKDWRLHYKEAFTKRRL